MRIGGTKVFGYGVFLSALLSILTPVATRYSVYALVIIRILQGVALVVNCFLLNEMIMKLSNN